MELFKDIFTEIKNDELENDSTVVLEEKITIVASAYQLVKLIPSEMVKTGFRKEVLNTRKIADERLKTAILNQMMKQARSLGKLHAVVAKDASGKNEQIVFQTSN